MNSQSLNLDSRYAQVFEDYQKSPITADNLFVITHLGQLKQMEALIGQKNLKNNLLIVLYTQKNLQVPSDVADNFSVNLFKQAVFVELPKNNHKPNVRKLHQIAKIYQLLVGACACKTLYVNSFEGHYSILLNLVKAKNIKTVLVEEGTATYKIGMMSAIDETTPKMTYQSVKSSFMQTIGGTQLFKQGVKIKKSYQKSKSLQGAIKEHRFSLKDKKRNQQFLNETKKFWLDIWSNPNVQKPLISLNKYGTVHHFYESFVDFDVVYASHTELLKGDFGRAKLERFFAYQDVEEQSGSVAQALIDEFTITADDVLYLSQRYALDLRLSMYSIERALRRLKGKGRIFVKLHPKEDEQVLKMYQAVVASSAGRVVVLDEYKFSAEALIALSSIQTVVGITSSTLIYAPLINPEIRVLSIADVICRDLANQQGCEKGTKVIAEHAKILQKFDAVEFL